MNIHDTGKAWHDTVHKVPSPMTPAKIRARRESERPSNGHDFIGHAKHNCENLDPQRLSSIMSPAFKLSKPRASIEWQRNATETSDLNQELCETKDFADEQVPMPDVLVFPVYLAYIFLNRNL
jgi:hypothetical protein